MAFKKLFDLYCEGLLDYSFHIVKDKAIAEDIVQHVWIKVWEKRHSINPELSFRSYLYTAVRNQALKYIRDTKDKFASLESIDSLADGTILQDDQMHDKETLKLINDAIDQLPNKCREIFVLNRFEGLSYNGEKTRGARRSTLRLTQVM